MSDHVSMSDLPRKPRIMVGGEFSAGKTRLINALIGRDVLPSQVTSTSLPPVWLVYGDAPGIMVGLDGAVQPLDFDAIEVEKTAFCVLPMKNHFLETVDLIDTPGNSDPNIPASCWERMLGYADGLVWCTSAMQAWRQSEKAACLDFPDDLRAAATLLVTQIDRLPDEKSRRKVMGRVKRESDGIFSDVQMASLIREADVELFSAHLQTLAERLEPRGEDAPLVDDLRLPQPALARPPQDVPSEESAPQPGTSSDEDTAEAPLDVAEVVELAKHQKPPATDASTLPGALTDDVLRDVREAAANAASRDGLNTGNGQARALWASIAAGADLTDIAQWQRCVATLLDRIDAEPEPLPEHDDPSAQQQTGSKGS